jgi:SAM-dependent methyltransferase
MTQLNRRFQSSAKYYLAGRPPYPTLLVRQVARRCGLRRSHRILDLGCGPGQLAIAFGRFAGTVVAVDPEPEMLRVARTAAFERSADHIEFIEASASALGPHLGRFRMVTMGRSFHWMDRVDTLARLDPIIEPHGSIVLFNDTHLEVPENRWHQEYRALLARYSDGEAGWQRRSAPDWISHEAVLLASPFPDLERIGVIERRRIEIDRLVDRAFSMSSTSPEKLGSNAGDLVQEIRKLMLDYAEDGRVVEVVESQALIAHRAESRDGLQHD